jgi:hypothetical protein
MSDHPNGWSEDLAWARNREPDPLWVHWFRLIASTHGSFSGTIKELKESHA